MRSCSFNGLSSNDTIVRVQPCPVNSSKPSNGCTPQAEDDEGISINGDSEGFDAPPYAVTLDV